ncbi:2-amino-4-hydroxy-6-hydroxymethyldihydropteridine diphosphokinase [Flavobacterium branchiophilum]|uniref:2-amino-4-hydroxy-6-hydroxymethyldihydropteridine pyrophosphokinase n=1 Tax=Flavobacterium branchiophilum TaxID=55197 RepID=A0A2H3KPR7_9FLAO|nr:2-amino-4-hydroxy-6-hydroxymethyldihydropteridine diphosphokinase [Flavobacterium branchiophilum]PDS26131.1 2-amino-4-hydroxy-6-hydroxymethyldihydropteridine diphosphokinase [Flavobacterium branchiophilum]
MSLEHQIILSLGSNQGHRLEHLIGAVQSIHAQIATVIKVSKVYESPAWGFDSDPFFNIAILLHTDKDCMTIAKQLWHLEQSMGRKPKTKSEYEARIIDIDLISFDQDIIENDHLQIPHKEMHRRQFVLCPMMDLEIVWEHPILKKNIPTLLAHCSDKSSCIPVATMEAPLSKFQFQNNNHIVIEGNIGAGKTTLTNKIAADFNGKTVLEQFSDNPFLPLFYQDASRYAFPLEMSFLAERYQQLADDLKQYDLFKDFLIADYHIFKSLIFAKVTLSDAEFRLYKTLFDIIYKEIPKPDLYIYLYQKTPKLIQNIQKRARLYEQSISETYLMQINNGYLDYIKSDKQLRVLIIDVSELDFVENHKDYLYILEQIDDFCKQKK